MSCSSAETSSSSRSGYSISRASSVGGGLGGDGVQAEALGRGVPARGALEEVEGGGARETRASTPSGVSTSTALGIARDLALACGRRVRLAMRSTAMTSAHVGLDGGHDVARREVRPRARRAARGCATRRAPGKASSASKAAVSRRPWPSLWRRLRLACVGIGTVMCGSWQLPLAIPDRVSARLD